MLGRGVLKVRTLIMQICTSAPTTLCLQVLESAMGLPGVRQTLGPQARARIGRKLVEPTLHERATIYLLLAQVGVRRCSYYEDAHSVRRCSHCGSQLVILVVFIVANSLSMQHSQQAQPGRVSA